MNGGGDVIMTVLLLFIDDAVSCFLLVLGNMCRIRAKVERSKNCCYCLVYCHNLLLL